MGMPSPLDVSTKLCRIAELAREDRSRCLTSLSHHIDVAFLEEAYRLRVLTLFEGGALTLSEGRRA